MLWFNKITFDKVVDILSKFGFELFQDSNDSKYYTSKRIPNLKIRVSNHFPVSPGNEVCIVINDGICLTKIAKCDNRGFSNIKKLEKYLTSILVGFSWYTRRVTIESNKCAEKMNNIKKEYEKSLKTYDKKLRNIKNELQKLIEVNQRYKNEIANKQKKLEQQENDINEIVNLLEDLNTQELGSLVKEMNGSCRTYKINHFPKDVQNFILDLIKEYYNTQSLCPSGQVLLKNVKNITRTFVFRILFFIIV